MSTTVLDYGMVFTTTELVVIRTAMDEAALVDALDDCLLTDAEMDDDWDATVRSRPNRG
ncbi:hypothetical protein VB773_21360 [Haloarculaceae archaeon H-GB2-1]|nr:hypothetical protein [Haloarculaceae archaeon H-GB1-1]MEA5389334.1 hypothetical protein [Haloarculaceae archaeon H-GB11]MEA5409867.1 hypothetical protein [Haloarculaceae archaeon H-GB2-1]